MSAVVVGGGLAGLAAARALQQQGRDFILLEATDRVGGRVRSFHTSGGFTLDRGFQVILDSYPMLTKLVDLASLEPCYFPCGASVFTPAGTLCLMHPLRHPGQAWKTVSSPFFSPKEKLGIGLLSLQALVQPDAAIFGSSPRKNEPSVAALLASRGITENAVHHFFRPFFGGVLLDANLQTSAAVFLYYLKMFILGRAFVPALGMEQLPRQIAAALPPDSIRLGAEVLRIRLQKERAVAVQMTDGTEIPCEQLVLATEEPVTARLLARRPPARPGRPVWTFYFSHTRSLPADPLLMLNASDGPVAHCVELSSVAPRLAPPGHHLISATVLEDGELGEEELLRATAENVCRMRGLPADSLRPVGHTMISYGVPDQPAGCLAQLARASGFPNVWLAGDQITAACIEGALRSGWQAGIAAAKN